ncbi:MAG TPA: ATPase [Bacteroidales bacterium]|nr:ATPase [Bacteroidales bacterium]
MIVLADSGSTKTDWCVIHDSKTYMFHSKGLNPFFVESNEIYSEIQRTYTVTVAPQEITKVFFYGAGCKAYESQLIVKRALQDFFSNATCCVDSDMVGAAIALHGNNPGLVAILGTGMSIAYWNGTDIQEMLPSLGFILGDEGGGAYIGKCFIQALFQNKLPIHLIEEWNHTFACTLPQVLEHVYKKPFPNRYLASFVPFVYKHRHDKAIQEMLQIIFNQFASQVFEIATKYNCNSISCVGSVAYFFKDFVYLALQKKSIELQETDSSPIQKLIQYYINN